jgi:membrane-associated phospholipid phosphatase
LTLAVVCAVLGIAVYGVFVCTRAGQRVDDAALVGRDRLTPKQIDDADDLLRTVDLASLVLLGGVVLLVAFVRGRWPLALAAGLLLLGANVTTQVLKEVLPRPDLLPGGDPLGTANSLPSGHTTIAMSLALAAVLVAPRRVRGAVAVVGAFYAGAVGAAVLAAGWHLPSDAVAALLVVTAWAALVATWGWRETGAEPGATAVASPLLVITGAGLAALVFGGLVVALAERRLGRLDAIDLGRAYAFATVAIIGSALLLTGLFLAVLRPPLGDARLAGSS